MKQLKLFSVFLFLGIGAGFVIPEVLESLFPSVTIIFYSGIIFLILHSWFNSNIYEYRNYYLIWILVYSSVYRIRIFFFGGSMVGADPDTYAIQISRLIVSGSVSSITLTFYDRAPFHIIQGAIVGIAANLSSPVASAVYPLLLGIFWPLISAAFIVRISPGSPHIVIIGSGSASLLAYSIRYSWNPIAQTTGVIFVSASLFTIYLFLQTGRRNWIVISLISMIGAIYTHKLAPLAITLSLTTAVIFGYLYPTKNRIVSKKLAFSLVLVYGLLTILQLVILTTQMRALFFPSAPTEPVVTSSVAFDPSTVVDYYAQVTYFYLLAIMSGVVWFAWVWSSIKRKKFGDIIYIFFVAPLAGLSALLYIFPFNIARSIFYSELFLLILIVVGFHKLCNTYSFSRHFILIAVLILIITGGVSPTSSPDHGLERQYLTQEEVHAKEWGYSNINGEIKTDLFYSSEVTPNQISDIGPDIKDGKTKFENGKFVDGSHHYLERTLILGKATPFAHRSCTGLITTKKGRLKVTFDPVEDLNQDHNRFYDSGCVLYYS